jgi:hypothetical protein
VFNRHESTRAALPMMLEQEVDGFGFALACDFLNELGYEGYAKPDVHLRDIFTELDLCPRNASDYQVFKAVVRIARHVGQSPYHVDKLFWLIGSGNFYKHPDIGSIGSKVREFVASAHLTLKPMVA